MFLILLIVYTFIQLKITLCSIHISIAVQLFNIYFLGIWATKIEIFAMALMLKTNIYIFSEKSTWNFFSKNGSLSINPGKSEKSMYLKHTNGNHFDVVLDVDVF